MYSRLCIHGYASNREYINAALMGYSRSDTSLLLGVTLIANAS
jgi:hypothetical protein